MSFCFFSHHKKSDRRTLVAFFAVTTFLMPAMLVAGCGDTNTDSTGGSTATISQVGSLTRPAPGMVEMIDSKNDNSVSQDITAAPRWLDIN